jgi:two-component system chemotaxis response regulator CheY
MGIVLVVDDDPGARKPLARLLEGEGYVVEVAADCGVAMAKVMGPARLDLILLDVGLPRMDGLTFLWRIRETAAGRSIPVIVVSGDGEEDTIRRAEELGVKDYLVKSRFKTCELLELVRRYVRKGEEAEGLVSET